VQINFDDILAEWSYRLPKGFPTVVDGKFVDRAEVEILNEILHETGQDQLPLPEALPVKTNMPSATEIQKVHNVISNSAAYKSIILPTQATQPGVEQQSRNGITFRVELAGKDERVLKAAQAAKALSQTIQKILGKGAIITPGKKSFTILFNGYKYTYLLKQTTKESKTDTDVKEGLSMVMSYYPEYIPVLDLTNIKQVAKDVASFMREDDSIAGLSASVEQKCLDYLEKVGKTDDVKVLREMVSNLNQNNSHANTFDMFFQKNKNYYIDRDKLFNQIRSVGHKITGYTADKWCPGDVYFIKNGSENKILSTLSQVSQMANSNKEQAIGVLNGLFSDKYLNPADKPIVAVSLKMEDAQAGKLKSGFEEYSNVPTEYGLDSTELKYTAEQYKEALVKYQKFFNTELRKADVDIVWTTDNASGFCDLSKITDLETLKFKYAAYKALNFILTKVAKNNMAKFDDALVSLVAFGLGVINQSSKFTKGFKVNPPFFKVMASRKGGATKPILFKPGSAMYIFNVDGTKKPKIGIEDNIGYKGLAVKMGLAIGVDKFDIRIRVNSNGNTQVNVELEKAKHIED
jgi:hypothetical protein